ncbi:ThiF family adenylyltransferase [Arthrobacter sp. fls2-241-R2A-172]|uniref:ThiF family adenylyltransferase n=1 Tax=Arthrobacter sp. fls2-241-R2A-172 TaxID=3040325 RepID=UPI00254B5D1C|nr:ThiF family adenylyltransferase [Arthrobacter sp. fls2-241-R2A-172]
MNLDDFAEYVAYTQQHFEEGILRSGFVEAENGWKGVLGEADNQVEVSVQLPERFPFKPPKVRPTLGDSVPWSWHRELDGSLCLIAEDDHEDLWWAEAPAFLEHVADWIEQAAAGWPDDRPDLDLDRYFLPSTDKQVYLYDEQASASNTFIRFRQEKNNVMRSGKGTPVRKARKSTKDYGGYVVDLGAVDVPPRSWADIAARIQPGINLDARITRGEIQVVLLKYMRGDHDGVIALRVFPSSNGIEARRLTSAANTAAARGARAGLQKTVLSSKSVAVIGVGALGSFTADMLARAGVGRLTLVDGDIVLPGNIVRHLVGRESVGLPKVDAVRDYIVTRYEHSLEDITVLKKDVTTAEQVARLVRDHDLVVNASADFSTTALLKVAAHSLGANTISVALQDDGNAFRVDILPTLNGTPPVPPLSTLRDEGQTLPELFEAGCGSPISPTPPHAVMEAAAAAVRHSIGLLAQQPLHPAGETRSLRTVSERQT